MRAIEAQGVVDSKGHLIVKDRIPLPASSAVRVIVLGPEEEDVDEGEWLRAASTNAAFDSPKDPAEDIYSLSDGIPFRDAE